VVLHGDREQQVIGRRLGVLDHDVEVAPLVEDAQVAQLHLGRAPIALGARAHQLVVRERALRVLVERLAVGVRGRRVQVEVLLLHVLAVVALGARQPEEALLEDRIGAVPQREREAHPALAIAEPQQAVLSPAVGAAPGLIVREVLPRRPLGRVVLAHGAPLPLGQVGAEALPVPLAARVLVQAARLGRRDVVVVGQGALIVRRGPPSFLLPV
jgi:hypothetical protein